MEDSYFFLCMDYNPNPEIVERVLKENVTDIQKVSDTMYTYACWRNKFSMDLHSVYEAVVYLMYDAFESENLLFDCFHISGPLEGAFSLLPEK